MERDVRRDLVLFEPLVEGEHRNEISLRKLLRLAPEESAESEELFSVPCFTSQPVTVVLLPDEDDAVVERLA